MTIAINYRENKTGNCYLAAFSYRNLEETVALVEKMNNEKPKFVPWNGREEAKCDERTYYVEVDDRDSSYWYN